VGAPATCQRPGAWPVRDQPHGHPNRIGGEGVSALLESALERWLDKRGLAEHLACSVRSIELAITRGLPHAMIFGRAKFRASEVEAWLERNGQLERRGEDTLPASDERKAA
jgi:hypothetical protein